MKTIPLTRGLVALVDDEDYERLSQFTWRSKGKYAVRWRVLADGHGSAVVWMHREVLGYRYGFIIDHADGNGLNNQRANLRHCTASENARNVARPNLSGFRGVQKKRRRYHVKKGGFALGVYDDIIHAARVYNWACLRLDGRFAVLNSVAKGSHLLPLPPAQKYIDKFLAEVGHLRAPNASVFRAKRALRRDPNRGLIKRFGVFFYVRDFGTETQFDLCLNTTEAQLARDRRESVEDLTIDELHILKYRRPFEMPGKEFVYWKCLNCGRIVLDPDPHDPCRGRISFKPVDPRELHPVALESVELPESPEAARARKDARNRRQREERARAKQRQAEEYERMALGYPPEYKVLKFPS